MSLFDAADNFLKKAQNVVTQKTRKQKLRLYCEGLKAKAGQVDFALKRLKALENQADGVVTSTDANEPSIQSNVEFYCDSFWAFLYSCLDVLGQVVNQGGKLGLNEREVSFNRVKKKLDASSSGSPEQKAFADCAKTRSFRNLDGYRNCSTHRRQIYVKEKVKFERQSSGYQTTTTGNNVTVERILCDNPLDMKPKTKQNRTIPKYLAETRDRIFKSIESILSSTRLVK